MKKHKTSTKNSPIEWKWHLVSEVKPPPCTPVFTWEPGKRGGIIESLMTYDPKHRIPNPTESVLFSSSTNPHHLYEINEDNDWVLVQPATGSGVEWKNGRWVFTQPVERMCVWVEEPPVYWAPYPPSPNL
jgi:hypothetical protein